MPAAELFASVLDRRLSALRRHLPAAIAGDVTGVHQARVASRRLREALPVLAEADPSGLVRRALRAVRRVTGALGPVRELDVALGLLAAHLEAHPEEAIEGMVVRAWLERLRANQREAMLDQLSEPRLARLWTRLERVQDATPELVATGEAAWRAALGGRILTRAASLHAEVTRTGVLYSPEPLHAVRIACKKLRYATELADDLRLGAAAIVVRALKRQQELLGRIHDLEVLAGLADRACAEAPRRVHAARLVGDWHRECRELHAGYLRTRAALQRTSTAAARLGRAVARTRTGVRGKTRPRRKRDDG